MIPESTLLERLRRAGDPRPRTLRNDRAAVIASVARNLHRVLNSRLGNAPAQLDLGIPAPSDIILAIPEAIAGLKRTIIDVIEKYEPRLVEVQASYLQQEDDLLALHFLVTGRLAGEDSTRVSFQTTYDKTGLIHLDA